MERPETPNPLTNGRVVAVDCSIPVYLHLVADSDGRRILRREDLCQIALCPSRWNGGYVTEDERTPSKEFGSLFDCLLLQPAKLQEYYKLAPATYQTKKGETKEWSWRSSTCRDWRTQMEENGVLVCGKEDLTEADSAAEAVRTHPIHGDQVTRLIANSRHQVLSVAEYHDKETGLIVPVKCLTDLVPNEDDPDFGKSLFDLKTAVSAHPRAWKKVVFERNYHVQGVLNLDIYTAATGEDRVEFRHLIVENVFPWEMARRCLSSEFIEIGRAKYLGALRAYCRGVKEGIWDSYRDPAAMLLPDGFEMCNPDPYMMQ